MTLSIDFGKPCRGPNRKMLNNQHVFIAVSTKVFPGSFFPCLLVICLGAKILETPHNFLKSKYSVLNFFFYEKISQIVIHRKQFCFWGRVSPHSCLPKHLKSSLQKSHQLSQICLGMLVTLAPPANWKTKDGWSPLLTWSFVFLQKEREKVNCWLQTQNVHTRNSVVVWFLISKRRDNL